MKLQSTGLAANVLVALALTLSPLAEPPKTGTVHGRVTDLFGFPVSGAQVEAFAKEGQGQLTVQTDGHGSYQFTNLALGQLTIRVNALGFLREQREIELGDAETVLVDFGLEAGRLADLPVSNINGIVYGPKGARLSDTTITIRNAFKDSLVFSSRTDHIGRYLLQIDTPGQYIVSAKKTGYVIGTKAIVVMPNLVRKDISANFTLLPLSLK